MRKFFRLAFISALIAATTSSYAQGNIKKGDVMAGGSIGFTTSKFADNNNTTSSFSLSPNVGYFFINNLSAGLRFDVNSQTSKEVNFKSTSSSYRITPFVRYYFLPAAEKLNVFADAGFGFGSNKYKETGNSDQTQSVSGFTITLGPAIFLIPSVALELGVGFNSDKYQNIDKRYNSLQVKAGFQIHLSGAGIKK